MNRPRTVLLIALFVAATGCTSDAPAAGATLPPIEASAIESLYADDLAALGFRLTDRGGLVDGDTYEASALGTHLSLYVTPLGLLAPTAYAAGMVDVTAVFATDVFDRWPGLASFDVCQEALRPEPDSEVPALTQVTLTRASAGLVDWRDATFADVVAATESDGTSTVFVLDDEVRAAVPSAESDGG